MRRFLTPEEKRRVVRHPLYIKYSGQVPDELWPEVLGEAKPAEVVEKKQGKRKATEEQAEKPDDGDSN